MIIKVNKYLVEEIKDMYDDYVIEGLKITSELLDYLATKDINEDKLNKLNKRITEINIILSLINAINGRD